MLIASNGEKIPGAAIRQALRISAGEPVAVVTAARIYGSSLGLPNPGLMPTRKEMNEQKEIVQKAVAAYREGRVGGLGSDCRHTAAVQDVRPGGGRPGRRTRAQ